ncbi:AAA family ATPase [Nonomuraea rhizosphaerae]|uniref:AAA family ATPase n=1 Tax=Nonomuraea rhizosphaerae TaxID=2665663 RepID=UPI001C5F6055|nr:ATP-binding protein [Nonomuraea rhizosphaerae]
MLLSFRFANHRSFRDEQQLNLVPVYEADHPQEFSALPVTAVFGANASGKSNAISALAYLCHMVTSSDRYSEPDRGVDRAPYRLDPEIAAEPSRYVADLLLDGVRHTYGFTVDDDQILEEWLYSYPLKRRRIVFERAGQDYRWGEGAQQTPLVQLSGITAPNVLFLTIAARARQELVVPVYNWFLRDVMVSYQHGLPKGRSLAAYVDRLDDPPRRKVIVDLVRAADVGIEDVSLSRPPEPQHEQPDLEYLSGKLAQGHRLPYEPRLLFSHAGARGNVLLEWHEQSAGTRQLFDLALKAEQALHRGSLLLVDEIDSSLHPVLTASLIRLFQNPEVNQRAGQLVLTTHDATLLGSLQGGEVLRRDQIWFAEKGDDGASTLFPLSDFHPRKQENRQRRYLNGSYGAIPEISDELFVKALTSRGEVGGIEEGA